MFRVFTPFPQHTAETFNCYLSFWAVTSVDVICEWFLGGEDWRGMKWNETEQRSGSSNSITLISGFAAAPRPRQGSPRGSWKGRTKVL